jgi:restriction system protein
MAKKKQSLFEDIAHIAAALPWQISLILAIAAYLGFHHVAAMPPTPLQIQPGNIGASMASNIWRAAASILQYIVPLAFALGALVSVLKRRKQSKLHDAVAATPHRGALEKMSWSEFEDLTAEVFRRKGFQVLERGGAGPDGGVDVELRMGSDKYLVQCKQWKSLKVGVATIRELYGVMAAEGAVGGFVVASGDFTSDARTFAEGRAIKLVHTTEVLRLVAETRKGEASGLTPAVKLNQAKAPAAETTPHCPKCGVPMVLRSSKKVGAVGNAFWGCSKFPGCRGVLKVD